EAGSTQDMPKISRVLWNRIILNRPLQFDSTVFYALQKYGTSLTQAQTRTQSPYNTYIHAGLPPGPIGNPGKNALLAALNPVKAHYLYFITDTKHKPYKTYFTASLKQFNQWKIQFQG